MTEQETTKEYRVTVRGQLETTMEMFALNEAVVRECVEHHQWTEVYGDLEGDEGSVCEALNRDMVMEVVKVEFIRELPPPPPRPPAIYDERIMHALLEMLAVCVQKEKAAFLQDGGQDHAYHLLYAHLQTLVAMWTAKGLKPKLHLPSPAELDAQRATSKC